MQILNRLDQYDQRVFLWFASACHYKILSLLARIISKSGDGYIQILLPLIMWFSLGSEAVDYIVVISAAFVAERSLYWVLKNSLKRKRPPEAIPLFEAIITASDEFSFPSGHTSSAFLLSTITAFYFPIAAIPLTIWASAVGLSRVIVGVHFPADILAGFCLGSGLAYGFHAFIFV